MFLALLGLAFVCHELDDVRLNGRVGCKHEETRGIETMLF